MDAIRHATGSNADIDALVAMSMRYHDAIGSYFMDATPESFRRMFEQIVDTDNALVLIAERDNVPVGTFVALRYHHPMSGAPIVNGLAWWVDPLARGGRTGIRLFKQAEQWATNKGATAFQMMSSSRELDDLYEALGFEERETLYEKALICR